MSTIETNSEQQEFDPDSLLGNPTQDEEPTQAAETFNFLLDYSIFVQRPCDDRFEINNQIFANATYYKFSNISNNEQSFVFKFEYSFDKASDLLMHCVSDSLLINKVKVNDLIVEFPKARNTKILKISYKETDKTNRTGIVTIKF